jgi:hypothetical protein
MVLYSTAYLFAFLYTQWTCLQPFPWSFSQEASGRIIWVLQPYNEKRELDFQAVLPHHHCMSENSSAAAVEGREA